MRWAYSEFGLDPENLPSKLGRGNVGKNMGDVAGDISAVDEGHQGIAGATDGHLALVEFPTPGTTWLVG